ncbi:ComEC/Rec2 family competence protein [Thiothrix lacustris]|nr:hypothetical protein [Thiothrix lacustris]WMP18669.1 hypothetical protein RCS87_06330 [Thiothrix lacustris]
MSLIMNESLTITMLPANEGDCLLITYGADTNKKHILIDGGLASTYQKAIKPYLATHGIQELELLVVTHVDRDHIEGVLSLLKDDSLDIKVNNIWFNGWYHLIGTTPAPPAPVEPVTALDPDEPAPVFGAVMGEELSPLIQQKGWAWNQQFGGGAVELSAVPNNVINFGEVQLTLLSPSRKKLEEMIPVWGKECAEAGMIPGVPIIPTPMARVSLSEAEKMQINVDALAAEKTKGDHSKANGCSIAFMLEYQGKRFLLSGDAHVDLLEAELKRLGASKAKPLRVDLFKIPHHGSQNNLSKTLLELLDCKHYLISTNGNHFQHPDDAAIAKIVKFGTAESTLHFNYKTRFNRHWEKAEWQETYHYRIEFPAEGEDGYKSLSF